MVHATPASFGLIYKAGDALATVGGLAASVPVAAALAIPVAPPILMAAAVVGATAAAYSTSRSISCLYDRRQHCQSLSLRERESRNSWLGVAGGVVGLGAMEATTALCAASAEVNAAAQLAVKGINVSSIVLSGTGVANSVYDLYLVSHALMSSYLLYIVCLPTYIQLCYTYNLVYTVIYACISLCYKLCSVIYTVQNSVSLQLTVKL